MINKPLDVIPAPVYEIRGQAPAGIQYFKDVLDARLRHAGMTNNTTSILR